MNENEICWDEIPDILTKEQFYQICHISKSTALYLLRSGKVPCEDSGKKTRRYRIKKEDAKRYLENRENTPEFYTVPRNWYVRNKVNMIDEEICTITSKDMERYYQRILKGLPDVLSVIDVIRITGYCKSTVNVWCSKGLLKSFRIGNANRIPKACLLTFLCSSYFGNIPRKSSCHIAMINELNLEKNSKK